MFLICELFDFSFVLHFLDEQKHNILRNPKNSLTCIICTEFIELVDEGITSNQTISQIEEILDQACAILGPLELECIDFWSINLERIIDLLVELYLTPAEVCEQLSLCP